MQKVCITNPERFFGDRRITREILESAIQVALKKIDKLMEDMEDDFPSSHSENNVYPAMKNVDGWHQGFYCGMLWLAYEVSGEEKYRAKAESLIESFYVRIVEKLGVTHHDMGFLYMPSCVAAYKLTGNERAKKAALLAAEQLMSRYHEKAGFIQAWGQMGADMRLIVDCMNNIPRLYWASEVTGDMKYWEAAKKHAWKTMNYAIRENGSTYHTYYFDEHGTPIKGATHQGASNDSTWARGQAWLVSGIPLTYKYLKDSEFITYFENVTNHFLNNLPEDYVPYWDMIFKDSDTEPKDSSAGAIAACGILQMLPLLDENNPLKELYAGAADKIMYSLIENYSTRNVSESNGLLLHATYHKRAGLGVDECNLWGCYYYMEALARMSKGVEAYW